MQLIVTGGSFQLPAEDLHIATLADVVDLGEEPDPFRPGEMRHRVKLIWEIIQPDGGKIQQWDFRSFSMHIKSNLYKVARALLRRSPVPNESINLKALVGKRTRIQIEHYQTRNGQTRAKVIGCFPMADSREADATDVDVPDDDLPPRLVNK